MNIWIDVAHTPQYNFYKQFMLMLVEKGHTVHLTVLDRGPLVKIIKRELAAYHDQIKVYVIGKHRMKKISAIIDANFIRIIKLFFWLSGKHIDVAISNNLFTACLGKLFRIPNYAFGDDPQVFDYKPKLWFANKSHYCLYEVPESYHISPKVDVLKCTKEWAYLAPSVFTPNPKALEKYGVRPKEYIFLREVSVGTVNYANQAPQAILAVKDLINSLCQSPSAGANTAPSAGANTALSNTGGNTAFYADSGESLQFCASGGEQFCNLDGKAPLGDVALTEKADVELAQKTDLADNAQASIKDAASGQIFSSKPCASANLPAAHTFKVLFSLEEKHRRNEYPEDWVLLQEPIEDIHSLMYYSAGLVSSGDSMAREAALLGIPAYYLGTRHSMPANLAAAKVAGLQNELTMPFSEWLSELKGKSEEVKTQEQEALRKKIDAEFIDINQYMLSLVNR